MGCGASADGSYDRFDSPARGQPNDKDNDDESKSTPSKSPRPFLKVLSRGNKASKGTVPAAGTGRSGKREKDRHKDDDDAPRQKGSAVNESAARYTKPDAVFDALARPDRPVVLVSARWIINKAKEHITERTMPFTGKDGVISTILLWNGKLQWLGHEEGEREDCLDLDLTALVWKNTKKGALLKANDSSRRDLKSVLVDPPAGPERDFLVRNIAELARKASKEITLTGFPALADDAEPLFKPAPSRAVMPHRQELEMIDGAILPVETLREMYDEAADHMSAVVLPLLVIWYWWTYLSLPF